MSVVDIKAYQGSSTVINGSKCRYQREPKELRASAQWRAPLTDKRAATASASYLAAMEACLASLKAKPKQKRTATIINFAAAKARLTG